MSTKQGKIYVFTGGGKGKTTAALGVVVRALSQGMRVGWVSWYKERLGEEKILGDKVEMYAVGKGFYKLPGDKATEAEHRQAAKRGLKKAGKLIKKVDVLVLDEVSKAIKDGLVKVDEMLELINRRNKTHLVLTGRGVDKQIVEVADLVTEMKKIKHPFDKGEKAVRGLDY